MLSKRKTTAVLRETALSCSVPAGQDESLQQQGVIAPCWENREVLLEEPHDLVIFDGLLISIL